jgi:uncharacterized protein YndB with AHSA1/START domain
MADTYRRHAVIDAPVEDVWSIVSDPHTHADWWPEIKHVRFEGDTDSGGEYTRVARRFGFLDLVDNVWVSEPVEHLKEVNFRCTQTGTYTRFALTPAQRETFVEVEAGVEPLGPMGRFVKIMSPLFFQRWLGDLLDALPDVVAQSRNASPAAAGKPEPSDAPR